MEHVDGLPQNINLFVFNVQNVKHIRLDMKTKLKELVNTMLREKIN